MNLTNLSPWLNRARMNNRSLPLRHEVSESRLPGIPYEYIFQDQAGTRLLQNRPGEWSQYVLSRSRACKRRGYSSTSRRSNIVSHVSEAFGLGAKRKVSPNRPRLPWLPSLFLAEPAI